MMLFARLIALEILGADFTGDVATTAHLVLVIVHKGLEGELAFRADGGFFLDDLLATRRRHDDHSSRTETWT
jgi:hypothetical protein